MTFGVSFFFEEVKKRETKAVVLATELNVQKNLATKWTEAHDRKDSRLRSSKGSYHLHYSTRLYDRNKATQSASLLVLFSHVERRQRQNENYPSFNSVKFDHPLGNLPSLVKKRSIII